MDDSDKESCFVKVKACSTLTIIVLAVQAVPSASAQQADGVVVPDSVTPARVLAGSELYNGGTCVFCHTVGGRGTGRNAPDLADAEWLHSEGDFEGIMSTIWWGVREDEMKAVTPRRFEMHPRGGMSIDFEAVKQITAYVWTISHPETHPFVTAQREFLDLVRDGRIDAALDLFREARDDDPDHLLLPERGLNLLGYAYMPDRAERAQALFELNAELHPDSWNVWDSLAESHMVQGDRAEAIRLYEKSLEMNPDNQNAREKLEELRDQ